MMVVSVRKTEWKPNFASPAYSTSLYQIRQPDAAPLHRSTAAQSRYSFGRRDDHAASVLTGVTRDAPSSFTRHNDQRSGPLHPPS